MQYAHFVTSLLSATPATPATSNAGLHAAQGICNYAARHRMKLVGCLATHFHIDHIGGWVPRELQAFVLGPFGSQAMGTGGAAPRLEGFAEMHWWHGCGALTHMRG